MSKREYESLIKIYENYLKVNGCTNFLPFYNQMSVADIQVVSAITTSTGINKRNVIIEYKQKGSLFQYQDETYFLIDTNKIKNLQTISELLKSPVLIMVEYDEIILCWEIKLDYIYPSTERLCNKTTMRGSDDKVIKDVTYLQYLDADYIIAKKNYQRAFKEQLTKYIRLRNETHN